MVRSVAGLYDRAFRRAVGAPQEAATGAAVITVVQFNVLADWASLAFPHNDQALLPWAAREDRVVAEIERLGPDLLTLEEVDHFDDVLQPRLRAFGLEGVHQRKQRGRAADGPAVFWRDAVFEHLRTDTLFFPPELSQCAVIVFLRHRASGTEFCVAGTHFKAKLEFEEMRVGQAKSVLARLAQVKAESPSTVLVLGGDLNSEPEYNSVPTLLGGDVSLESAYARFDDSAPHGYPPYTTLKRREELLAHVIDYIFVERKGALTLLELLDFPPMADVAADPLPNARYPSDHMAIAARYALAPSSNASAL